MKRAGAPGYSPPVGGRRPCRERGFCYLDVDMRGRRWFLPAVFAVLIPAILTGWTLTAVSAETSSPAPTGSPSALPGDPNNGAQVFSQQGCTTCHGASLEGGIGAKLNPIQHFPGVADPLDPNYLRMTIRNGRSGDAGFSAQMPAFTPDKLSDKDLNDVIAYIIQQNQSGSAALGPVELARSDVFWVSLTIFLLVMVTLLLARYNMRWIARRAAARRG